MYDIIIIGSGPAGLSAAVYAIRAGKNVLVVEKDYEGTGQIALGSHVDNYLGLPGISGYDLGEKFRNHAETLGVEFKTGNVISVDKYNDASVGADVFKIAVKVRKKEETYLSRALIYCAGASHRKLGIEGEERLLGQGVSYCATCDGSFCKEKPVVIVGGGDTALDDALYLSDIASQVTLVHRRDFFRGAKATLDKLKNKKNVRIITGANVVEIQGDNHVSAVKLDNGEVIATEAIFIAVGMLPQTELLKNSESIEVEYDEAGYIKAGEDGKTSVKGFYVAGDIRSKALRQVVTAVADGANAVNSIVSEL